MGALVGYSALSVVLVVPERPVQLIQVSLVPAAI